jgi:hypothetical protein
MKNANLTNPSTGPEVGLGFDKAKGIARKLGLNAKTISRWGDAGRISRFKLSPRVVLYSEREIAELIESSRVAGRESDRL